MIQAGKQSIPSPGAAEVVAVPPADWAHTTMGRIGSTYGGLTGKAKVDFGRGSGKYVTFLNVLENVKIDPTLFEAVDVRPGESQNAVLRGDLLFNGTSETPEDLALAAVLESEVSGLFLNSFCFGFRIDDPQRHDARFLAYFFRGPTGRQLMSALAQGATRYNMSKRQFLKLAFALPPFPEQRAIAEALSDVDGLLEALEALIAKKRAIKQGAMQQLLTGKTRLPGFSGKWETKRLGEVAQIKTGSRNNEDKVADGQYPFFVRSEHVERINSYSHDCEAILVPGEGRVGEIFHYVEGRFDVHQRVYAITKFAPEVSSKFAYFHMAMKFGAWAMQNTVKATVDSLRLPTFKNFSMVVPPSIDEQTAIATVLSDMDTEIAALEARRDKARAIKQGMMQELLTGRVRLVAPQGGANA